MSFQVRQLFPISIKKKRGGGVGSDISVSHQFQLFSYSTVIFLKHIVKLWACFHCCWCMKWHMTLWSWPLEEKDMESKYSC